MAGNLSAINGQFYTVNNPILDLQKSLGMPQFRTEGNIKPDYLKWLQQNNVVTPFQSQPQMPAQNGQMGAMTGKFPAALGNQFNHLSQQASDALYGGILGYQPKPITSPTGNQYQPPTNQGFQFPFGLLNRNFMGY